MGLLLLFDLSAGLCVWCSVFVCISLLGLFAGCFDVCVLLRLLFGSLLGVVCWVFVCLWLFGGLFCCFFVAVCYWVCCCGVMLFVCFVGHWPNLL